MAARKKKGSKKKGAKKGAAPARKKADFHRDIPSEIKPHLTSGGKTDLVMRGEGGRTAGLPLDLYTVYILEQNRKGSKKADEALAQMIAKEFPDSKREFTASFVNTCRTAYNNGRLRAQQAGHLAEPKSEVPRFGKGGEAEEVKRGRRKGTVVGPKKTKGKKGGNKKLKKLRRRVAA